MTICRTLALSAATCGFLLGGAAIAAGITVHDARNRDVTISDPARIVSIGGAITEILYALGFEDRLAGVDTTSLYPAAARDKPNVGYMRQLSAEGVLGLNPSLVLAVQGSGPKETMDVLEAAKVPLVLVPETFSEQGLLDKIKLVGHAMGADKRAECLTAVVTDDLAQLRELRAKVTKPVRVMFVMSLLNGRAMAAGKNTAANEIIALAGAVNAIDGYDGYKIINDEAIVAAKPDVVLSIQRGKDSVDAETVYLPSGLRADAPSQRTRPSSRWKAFICSASGRARRPQRATSRSSSIRRWRRRLRHSSRRQSPQTAGCDGPLRQRGTCEAAQRVCIAPARFADPHLPARRACRRGADRAHDGRRRNSAGAAAGRARPVGRRAAGPSLARDQLVLWSIRIPRIAAAAMVGALLAASGAIMQGLFRNPLADPALVGVSSGGALAAAAAIVFTDSQIGQSLRFMQHQLLPIAAFAGSLVTTVVLYSIASRSGRTSIAIFLLAGIAIAAIANAGIGLLVFIADDRQLRDITFWLLGSLSGATWPKLATLAPVLGLALIACVSIARGLDVLVLGEAEAFHSGVDVERLKRISIVLVSAMTGRCGFGLRRGRLCRHRGAASAAAGDRAGAPAAAAGLDAVGRGADGRAPIRWPAPSWRRRKCRSAS